MMNPVLRREMMTALRSWKNFGILILYFLVMFLGVFLFFQGTIGNTYNFTFNPSNMVYLYVVLAGIQLALMMLSVPSLTAGSISGEREKQTLDLLLMTKMSPLAIVVGKLFASMAFILLLIFSTLPIFSVAFYFGSVQIGSLLLMMGFTLTTAFMLGGISICFSCIFRKTVVSIMLVYVIVGILCFGTFLWAMVPYIMGNAYQEPSTLVTVLKLIPNPLVSFLSLMDTQLGLGSLNFFVFYYSEAENSAITNWLLSNLWVAHMVFQVVVGAIGVLISAYLISPSREKKGKEKEKTAKTK